MGFDTLFVPDHLLFERHLPNVDLVEGERRGIWEVWTLLSALAEATRRVTFGPFVLCTSFRNPALIAKMAATIDEVSGGRFLMALGAGWHEPEYRAFGFPFDRRVSRFEEALQIIVPLLREGRVDFAGQFYQARDCELRPRGPRPNGPPIWIGGGRPRMLRLVARWADVYNCDFKVAAREVSEAFAALDAACAEVGRDPTTIERTAALRVAILTPDEARARGRAPGARLEPFELTGWRRSAVAGTPEELVAILQAFEAAGTQHLTCFITMPTGLAGVQRFEPVLRALKG